MSYEKKVLVLRQIADGYSLGGKQVSGIVRVECENGVCDFYLSLINLLSVNDGSYHLFIADTNKKIYTFDVGKRPTSIAKKLLPCPDLSKGLAVSLCFIRDNLPYQVLGGASPDCPVNLAKLNSIVADTCLSSFKAQQKEAVPCDQSSNTSKPVETPLDCEFNPTTYDDEAVATENYFDTDQKIQNKLNAIKEWDFEDCSYEDELFDSPSKEETSKKQTCGCQPKNEASFCTGGEFSQKTPYYLTAKSELQELFDKFPPENCLKGIFPDSRWVKINYAQNKYYLVGVIKENQTEKYICYGVPARYSQTPPKELAGFCSFIPLSVYDMHGDGFWMIFQDAVTGNCLTPNQD